MKTSNVKQVANIKEWNGKNGLLYYHNLEMENGDKINLAKKSKLSVGAEVHYEILEEGQQEYNKAKSVNPNFNGANNVSQAPSRSNPDVQDQIIRQSSVKAAIDLLIAKGDNITISGTLDVADIIFQYCKNGVNTVVTTEKTKDLPF